MINIIVMGHGGYAEGIRKNLEMLSGVPQQMHFLDLTEEGLPQLEEKLNALLDTLGDQEILYACDLLGASPFRVAALKCMMSPQKQVLVTGLNTMAYVELALPDPELSLHELADRAVNTTKESVTKFTLPEEI